MKLKCVLTSEQVLEIIQNHLRQQGVNACDIKHVLVDVTHCGDYQYDGVIFEIDTRDNH